MKVPSPPFTARTVLIHQHDAAHRLRGPAPDEEGFDILRTGKVTHRNCRHFVNLDDLPDPPRKVRESHHIPDKGNPVPAHNGDPTLLSARVDGQDHVACPGTKLLHLGFPSPHSLCQWRPVQTGREFFPESSRSCSFQWNGGLTQVDGKAVRVNEGEFTKTPPVCPLLQMGGNGGQYWVMVKVPGGCGSRILFLGICLKTPRRAL